MPRDPWQVAGMSLPPHYGLQGLLGVVPCCTQGPARVCKGGVRRRTGSPPGHAGGVPMAQPGTRWNSQGGVLLLHCWPAGSHGGGTQVHLGARRGSQQGSTGASGCPLGLAGASPPPHLGPARALRGFHLSNPWPTETHRWDPPQQLGILRGSHSRVHHCTGCTTATGRLLGLVGGSINSAWGSTWAHSEGPPQQPVACRGLQGDPPKHPWARQGSIPLCLGAARACMGESITVTGRLPGLAGWVQCSNQRPTGAPRGLSTDVTGGLLVLASEGPPTRLVSHWGSQGGSTTTLGAHKGSQRGVLQCPGVCRGSHGGSTKVPQGLTLLSGGVPVPHPGAHHGLLLQVCRCAQGPARSPRGVHHCTCGPAVVHRGVHRSSWGPASARRGGSSAAPGGLPRVTIRGPLPLLGALHGLLACFGCLDQGPAEA